MSMTTFLYAADALRIEDGVGFHVETALAPVTERSPGPRAADPTVANRNARSMSAFLGGLAGVQGAPGSKKPKGRRR